MENKNTTKGNFTKIESEKKIEKKLCSEIQRLKGWSLKLFPIHVSGLPDRICLLPGGRTFFVELKTTKKEATIIQKSIHKKLMSLGFAVYVIDSTEQLKNILSGYEGN